MPSREPVDTLVRTKDLPWLKLAEGVDFKVLRISAETGIYTILLRGQAGSTIAPHRHLAAAEYFMLKGHIKYRAGEAKAGDYGHEPLGAYHEKTTFIEDTEMYYTGYGPVAFLGEKGEIAQILDGESLRAQMAASL